MRDQFILNSRLITPGTPWASILTPLEPNETEDDIDDLETIQGIPVISISTSDAADTSPWAAEDDRRDYSMDIQMLFEPPSSSTTSSSANGSEQAAIRARKQHIIRCRPCGQLVLLSKFVNHLYKCPSVSKKELSEIRKKTMLAQQTEDGPVEKGDKREKQPAKSRPTFVSLRKLRMQRKNRFYSEEFHMALKRKSLEDAAMATSKREAAAQTKVARITKQLVKQQRKRIVDDEDEDEDNEDEREGEKEDEDMDDEVEQNSKSYQERDALDLWDILRKPILPRFLRRGFCQRTPLPFIPEVSNRKKAPAISLLAEKEDDHVVSFAKRLGEEFEWTKVMQLALPAIATSRPSLVASPEVAAVNRYPRHVVSSGAEAGSLVQAAAANSAVGNPGSSPNPPPGAPLPQTSLAVSLLLMRKKNWKMLNMTQLRYMTPGPPPTRTPMFHGQSFFAAPGAFHTDSRQAKFALPAPPQSGNPNMPSSSGLPPSMASVNRPLMPNGMMVPNGPTAPNGVNPMAGKDPNAQMSDALPQANNAVPPNSKAGANLLPAKRGADGKAARGGSAAAALAAQGNGGGAANMGAAAMMPPSALPVAATTQPPAKRAKLTKAQQAAVAKANAAAAAGMTGVNFPALTPSVPPSASRPAPARNRKGSEANLQAAAAAAAAAAGIPAPSGVPAGTGSESSSSFMASASNSYSGLPPKAHIDNSLLPHNAGSPSIGMNHTAWAAMNHVPHQPQQNPNYPNQPGLDMSNPQAAAQFAAQMAAAQAAVRKQQGQALAGAHMNMSPSTQFNPSMGMPNLQASAQSSPSSSSPPPAVGQAAAAAAAAARGGRIAANAKRGVRGNVATASRGGAGLAAKGTGAIGGINSGGIPVGMNMAAAQAAAGLSPNLAMAASGGSMGGSPPMSMQHLKGGQHLGTMQPTSQMHAAAAAAAAAAHAKQQANPSMARVNTGNMNAAAVAAAQANRQGPGESPRMAGTPNTASPAMVAAAAAAANQRAKQESMSMLQQQQQQQQQARAAAATAARGGAVGVNAQQAALHMGMQHQLQQQQAMANMAAQAQAARGGKAAAVMAQMQGRGGTRVMAGGGGSMPQAMTGASMAHGSPPNLAKKPSMAKSAVVKAAVAAASKPNDVMRKPGMPPQGMAPHGNMATMPMMSVVPQQMGGQQPMHSMHPSALLSANAASVAASKETEELLAAIDDLDFDLFN